MSRYTPGPKVLTLQDFCDYYTKHELFFILNGSDYPPDMHTSTHIGLRKLVDICDLIAREKLCVAKLCESPYKDVLQESCPTCGMKGWIVGVDEVCGATKFRCAELHTWNYKGQDKPVDPVCKDKTHGEKPCEQTCSKCGSPDVNRVFLFKGTKVTPANGSYLDAKRSIPKDIIRSHCRCCQYEWDVKPLS